MSVLEQNVYTRKLPASYVVALMQHYRLDISELLQTRGVPSTNKRPNVKKSGHVKSKMDCPAYLYQSRHQD